MSDDCFPDHVLLPGVGDAAVQRLTVEWSFVADYKAAAVFGGYGGIAVRRPCLFCEAPRDCLRQAGAARNFASAQRAGAYAERFRKPLADASSKVRRRWVGLMLGAASWRACLSQPSLMRACALAGH